ncbi:neurofilament heavy polypeptide-like isoform X3 [Cyclopterus lumpus]|uniref:neurofilament heavy polypeptide-like isoform X3 n=1 Tax=Cyclopterus lumpus TaxID=8103 RepID=UPI0014875B11|nr:neurofilament heavy polypeptide-like isoform X3 [Cyclopterus lumpus]
MKFPVDLLANVSQAELERLSHNYMNNLLYSNPDCPDHLALSDFTQVTIDISSVGFVPLYGCGGEQKILALFSPSDPFIAVALYLMDRWWAVDDILKTADPTRGGAVEVKTMGEKIVLYILNRVVYRAKEMSPEELPFLCHGEKDHAKILWNDGEAAGFYSVKPAGSFCSSFSTRSYQLPVMDSIFVRRCQRGKGFGLQMLEDFVLSFQEDCLGLRYPISKFMYKVCEKYLCQYPGDTDLLWEVQSIGGPKQRTNIARKIQAMDQSAVSRSLTFTEEALVITERTQKDVVITTQIKTAGSMECTVEIVEEVTVLSVSKVSDAAVPLTARGGSSGSKRRKMGEKIGEDKSEKVIRIEDIEAESPSEDQVSARQKTELHISELVKTEGMSSVAPEEQGEIMVDTAPDDAAKMLDHPNTILAHQDLEEADVTLAPTTEEPQLGDDAPQNLNSVSCDSQITVENVASEIEEDTAALAVSKEQEPSLSTCVTSENGEAGKTGRANVEAVTTVQSTTPRWRSTLPDTAATAVPKENEDEIVTDPSENEQNGEEVETSVIQNKTDVPDNEIDEPPAEAAGEEKADEQAAYKQVEEHHQVANDAVTVTVTMEEEQCAISEMCADREADTPGGDDAEGDLPVAEEEAPVVETRALRRKTKTSTATPRRKTTRSREQVDAQEAEQKDAVEVITGLESVPPTEVDERKAPEEDEIEVENEDLVTAEVESEEGTMTMTVEEEDTAGVTAAADELVQEETDAPLPSPPTDSAVLPPVEEEATPSAEEQQSEDMATQLSDLRRMSVVLVDLQKAHHDVQDEAAATEEGLPVRKTAAEAEEEAANHHDAQEDGQVDCTETVADEDTEASFEQHDHEVKTSVVAEEAVAKQDIVEGEQSTSTSEMAEGAQETMLTAKDEQANDASEEEAPVVERVRSSGEKALRATTKKPDDKQEEEAPGEKITEEVEPSLEIRVLRKGRKPAEAAPRRPSKIARTQYQTEEAGEEEATPAEEIEGEEEEAGPESPEEKGIEVEEMKKEEKAHNAAGEECTVGHAEQTKDASTAEAGVLEEEDNSVEAVYGIGTNTFLPTSVEVEEINTAVEEETTVVEQPTAAAEVGSDAAIAEEEALVENALVVAEEDTPAATKRAFRSKQKASPATPSPRSRRQKVDSPRRSVRKRTKVDYRENNVGERDETEANTDKEKEVPVASDEDQGANKSECSSNADEVGEAAGSSQEDEEFEQNTSEEEEEPIVIGKRVLRGRSVPSVIITPQSKSRCRSSKVSSEEKSPRSAQKRKSTEVTRKSKRLSRV